MPVEDPVPLRQKYYNATVTRLQKVHEDLMVMRVRPDYPLPKHLPGQYSTLGLGNWEPRHPGAQPEVPKPDEGPKLIRRAYSISCSVLDDDNALLDREHADWLEFYIVLVREADKAPPALTPRLFLLNEGDRVFLGEKIAGHFTLETVKPTDTILFLATGTGEAPHNYMLWELLTKKHPGKILSACCVRYRRDLGYLPIHDILMKRHANYQYLALTTREAVDAGQKVYVQDLITSGQLEQRIAETLDPARTHVFLCGNPKMIGVPEHDRVTQEWVYPKPLGIIEILEKRGFRRDQPAVKFKGNIHFEEYW